MYIDHDRYLIEQDVLCVVLITHERQLLGWVRSQKEKVKGESEIRNRNGRPLDLIFHAQ